MFQGMVFPQLVQFAPEKNMVFTACQKNKRWVLQVSTSVFFLCTRAEGPPIKLEARGEVRKLAGLGQGGNRKEGLAR